MFANSTSSDPIDEKLPSALKEDEEEKPETTARTNLDLLIARGERRLTDVGLNDGRGGGGVYIAVDHDDVNDELMAEELVAVWWMKV